MYCSKCGSQMGAQDLFCGVCGEPAEVSEPLSKFVPATDVQSPKRDAGRMAIAAIAGAAVVVAVVAAILLGWIRLPWMSDASEDVAATAEVAEDAAQGSLGDAEGDSPGADAEDAGTDAAADAPATEDAGEIDLSNVEDRYKLNLYLSNFTEVGFYTNSGSERGNIYRYGLLDSWKIARFCVYHAGRNISDAWEYTEGSQWYFFTGTNSNGGEWYYNVRVAADLVEWIAAYFLGIDFDASQLTGDFQYQDGYVYFYVTNGEGLPEGVAYATTVENLGDGSYRVEFEVYGGPNNDYDVKDASFYSMSADELMECFEVSGPWCVGEAVVTPVREDDAAPFKLLSYYTVQL